MKILILGGNGNIGLPISQQLARTQTVYIYCRHPVPGKDDPAGLHYVQGDNSDANAILDLHEQVGFDVVISFLIQTPEQAARDIELFGTTIRQYIYISSATVYNRELTVCFTEESPLGNPFSAYGRRKLACEKVFLQAYRQSEFPVTIVRPSQTYSRDRIPLSLKGKSCWSVLARILADEPVIVHGDGTSIWVSTHSEDFARGLIPLVGRVDTLGEAYQITSDEWLTWNQMYQMLGNLTGHPVLIHHIPTDQLATSREYDWQTAIQGDKQYSVLFDNRKLHEIAPEFSCQITMEAGYRRYLEYMDEHPELKVRDQAFDVWCDYVIKTGAIR